MRKGNTLAKPNGKRGVIFMKYIVVGYFTGFSRSPCLR